MELLLVIKIVCFCIHEFSKGKGIENKGLEITHFGLIVDSFDKVMKKLKSHNVPIVYPEPVYYHSSESIYFIDPNGYKIEISEFRGGGIE
ncbi:VOC family protein [Vibrio sp. PP-XX7]